MCKERTIGIYFSGTGNTRYCVEKFMLEYCGTKKLIPIESEFTYVAIQESDFIIFGYPVYFSNVPKIVYDFIERNGSMLTNKKIFIISTMALFSGDGTGCSARLFQKHGAIVVGGIKVRMPDCIGDERVLKYSLSKNRKIIFKAEKKIKNTVRKMREDKVVGEGLSLFSRILGGAGQRVCFNKTKEYNSQLSINYDKCIGCGKCAKICPMHNFDIVGDKVIPRGHCTICYRCFSECPRQAILILGKKVYEQCNIKRYIEDNK